MQSLDNLLVMDRCTSCDREQASTWNFCIYCGRPLVSDDQNSLDGIPAAIRADSEVPPRKKYDGPFWVGVGMGVLGLTLIIFAAIQIYGSHG